jgi:hypothetical protein
MNERGLCKRASVADVEKQRSSVDLLDDLGELARVVAHAERLDTHIPLRVL